MKIKYVSFDLYDTLVKRIFSVEKLYQIMEKCLEERLSIKIDHFQKKRIDSENEIISKGLTNYTLKDVYASSTFSYLSDTERKCLIQFEEECEINNTIPNYKGKKLYERIKNYNIICISDMYLEEKVIRQILHKNGYKITNVYVSCERKASKKEKELFRKVLEDLGIKHNELLHIGDAKRSDYINPKLLGIHSKLIINKKDKLTKTGNYYYDLGFNILGPILYEFCHWIHRNSDDYKILFLSREGEFIKTCYDILFQSDSEILYVSRKAVIQGTIKVFLQYGEVNELMSLILLKQDETVKDFLRRTGLNTNEIIRLLQQQGIDMRKNIDYRIADFLRNNKAIIIRELEEENVIFDCYLNSLLKEKNVFVDVGWQGSMQKIIEKYLFYKQSSKKVTGLYFGITDNENKKGFIFSENNRMCQNILCFSGLLETIMMPNHGSVLGYVVNGSKVTPQFDIWEFNSEGKSILDNIQKGVLDLINKVSYFGIKECFNKDEYVNKLLKIGCWPTLTDIKSLANLDFYDNSQMYQLVEKANIFDLIRLESVKGKFIYSRWKTAFLKQIFLLPFPYNWLINFARRKRDEKI